ncbi:MAG: DinB family protein, partial [Planctomycetaceae bacterium]
MNARDAIKLNLNMSDMIVRSYLSDLSDSDLLIRPVAGTNHIAWQLGHLIC